MDEFDYRIDYNISDKNAQIILVVLARAIKIIENEDELGGIDLNGSKLLFELKCCKKLIGKVGCLKTCIEMIGLEQYCGLLAAMSILEWGDNEMILHAYLQYECYCYHATFDERRDLIRHQAAH